MENNPNKTSTASALDGVAVFLATGCYASLIPTALINRFKTDKNAQSLINKKLTGAGLMGSLEGAATYYFLPASLANAWWALLAGLGLSVIISARAEKALHSHDDSRIVIDEWIGAWIALWGMGQSLSVGFVLAVVFFRFFDVFKGPIGGRLQNLPGGWGVTLDDVYAGLAANLLWRLSVGIFPIPH